ncbi:MAG: flavodoxin-dependent (E)-4-hydroxy-3-methylbut-2-enyl-diphosphate synthase [Spirochaetales bacterium]|jgi:(E)-4-hydroxy-3-methylbut-2-enyl-diphosphate synthase|nr:flavodoxin-dependent (E)-4-hydroxy-3-methylbut-2-enyl-diphosphate synthase [Spirochaetales bacterium]
MEQKNKVPITVFAGGLPIGGGHPVRLQTMWKAPLSEGVFTETVRKVELLASYGCELLRFAVPDADTAALLCRMQDNVSIPLVADIHFDHTLALICLDKLPKIRINPGNIGSAHKVREVVRKAADKGAAIRVGVNAGSLPAHLRNEDDVAAAMVSAAEEDLQILDSLGFQNVLFSLKSSDIKTTIKANELFSVKYDYPLHLGVTEAGPPIRGTVKSTAAMVPLLQAGIGSTIRVSLSGPCEDELVAGREIIAAAGKGSRGVNIVSCPRCGRSGFDVHGFLKKVEPWLLGLDADFTVAIMGCVVNGPEEARHADIGICGSGKKALLFRDGEIVRRVDPEDTELAFREEVEKLCREKDSL